MSDLLAELREERGKHKQFDSTRHSQIECSECRCVWPCPLSRALDGMIAGVEQLRPGGPTMMKIRIEDAMARAYRGGPDAEAE